MAKKEIQIFSVTLLDLLSGALGAVIILYVIIDKNPYKTSGGFEKELLMCDSTVDNGLQELGLKVDAVKNDLPSDEYNDLKQQIEIVENDITCFREIIKEQQKSIQNLEKQLQNARDSITVLQAENAKLKAQIVSHQRKIAELEKELDKCDEQLKELRSEVEKLTSENGRLKTELNTSRAELQKWRSEANFIVVTLSWPTSRQDVDLHVIDPSGAEFYYKQKTIAGRRGELTEDDKIGPGIEIWQINGAYSGEYKLMANLYDRKLNPLNPRLTCKVYYRNGVKTMRNLTLTQVGSKVLIGTIAVGADGEINFR